MTTEIVIRIIIIRFQTAFYNNNNNNNNNEKCIHNLSLRIGSEETAWET